MKGASTLTVYEKPTCTTCRKMVKLLNEQGVEFEKLPAHNPQFEIYHCFLRDPNGYLVEIQRFDDPGWNQPDHS